MIHLDASFLIEALRAGSPQSARLEAWARANETIAMRAVAWTEFLCGPLDATTASLATMIGDKDYTVEMATVAARLFTVQPYRAATQLLDRLHDCSRRHLGGHCHRH